MVAAISPATAAGQATLQEIDDYARLGRAEEARAALLVWWEDSLDVASRADVQLALWLRGRLTVDPTQATRDFRRLVVEYPGGPFTDQALFRLAQAAYAQGDDEGARLHMASLSRDYPGSAVLREAEAWLLGAGSVPSPQPPAQREVAEERVTEPAPEEPPADPRPADPGRYAVQLGAFSEEGRAAALFDLARGADLNVRLVRVTGSRLIHVRVGRFDTSAEATAFFRSVVSLGFTAAVVRDSHNEELVRG